jgi:glycosyltransferase involved in cell wall biosynthesis
MRSLIFVSYEIYPFTEGGIGRVLYNIFNKMDQLDRMRSTLVLVDTSVDSLHFEAAIPDVKLIFVDTNAVSDGGLLPSSPPAVAYSTTRRHWQSAVVFREIERLSRSEQVDYVEFPDWGGLAFSTLQERRFRGFLNDTTIAIRLHSAHTVIANTEPHLMTQTDLNLCDIERKCLRDCDVIIAQLHSVSEATRVIFGFSKPEWDHRVIIHAPPVLLEHTSTPSTSIPFAATQPILFTSKLQRFKRPEVFVKGVSQFLRKYPCYAGDVVFVAIGGLDTHFEQHVKSLIPRELSNRFRFIHAAQAAEREALVATGTVVVPSAFESFCLAAYEASLGGARLVLNGCNPAFDSSTPWIDGVNCIKFNGTIAGLVEALARNCSNQKTLVPVNPPKDTWPWKLHKSHCRRFEETPGQEVVSVVISELNQNRPLAETVDTVLSQTYKNVEIILLEDSSIDTGLCRSELYSCDKVRVLRLPSNAGKAAMCNAGIEASSGSYILLLQAGNLVTPQFISLGVAALENNPEFSVVVTQAAFFNEKSARSGGGFPIELEDYAVCTGEAILAGTFENRFSSASALFRRDVFDRLRFLEDLDCYEEWSLYLRMCDLGMRFIVTTDIHCFYRMYSDFVTHQCQALGATIAYSDLIRTSAPADLRIKSRHLAVSSRYSPLASFKAHSQTKTSSMDSVIGNNSLPSVYGATPFDHEIVFGSLKIGQFLYRKAPTMLNLALAICRASWRLLRHL